MKNKNTNVEEHIISSSPTERLILIVYSNNSIGIETEYFSLGHWKVDSSDRNIFLSEEEIIKIKEILFG